VRWLRGHAFLRDLTLLSACTGVFQSMANGVFVLYVLEELRLPSGDFGLVLLGAGVGGLLGGVATPHLAKRFGRGPMLTGGAVVSALGMAAMGFTREGYLGTALFAISAAGVMVWNVLTMSLRQALIPEQLFGRVQGAYRTLVWGGIPVGAVLGGVFADAFGVRPVFVIGGAGLFVCALWLARVVRMHHDLLVDEQEIPAEPAAQPA
jgi:predicted MFS family arabinose efflux permease